MSDYEDSFDEESTDASSHPSSHHTPTSPNVPVPVPAVPAVPLAVPVPVPVPVPAPVSDLFTPAALPTAAVSDDGSHGSERRSTGTDLLERALAAGIWRKGVDEETGRPCYHNVLTKERTWDLRKWLLGESSRQESEASTRRSSAMPGRGESLSTYSEATNGDGDPARFARAQNVDLGSEFNQFGDFVAFNSHSTSIARSSMPFGSPLQATSESAASGSGKPSLVSAPFTSPKPSIAALPTGSDAAQSGSRRSSDRSQGAHRPDSPHATAPPAPGANAGDEEGSSVDPSSVFSTLSQHLKAPTTAAPSAAPDVAPLDSVHDASTGPLSSAGGVPLLSLSSAVLGRRSGDASALTSSRAALISPASPPALHMTLPDLPQPGLERGRYAGGSAPALTLVPPYHGASSGLAQPSSTAAPGLTYMTQPPPPPLPPPSAYAAPSPAAAAAPAPPPEERRIVELRETSEAVERLVKAFAMLRGHAPAPTEPAAARAASQRTTITAQAHASTQPGTMQTMHTLLSSSPATSATLPTAAPARARPALADPLRADVPRDAEAEQLVESVLLSCVVEMLQSRATQEATTSHLVQRLKQRPTHETVSAESFRTGDASPTSPSPPALSRDRTGAGRGNVFNLFDGEMRAFSGDGEDADTALYHSVQQALRTYVLSHVVGARGRIAPPSTPASPPADASQATTMSPHLAWTLLLDLLAVCTDIAETRFSDAGPSGGLTQPVLVRYCGETALEHLVRNAMHCLPFEAVASTAAPSAWSAAHPDEPAARPLFRLEFWVTRQKLFVVMEAVRECLRFDILQEASSFPSASFEAGSAALRLIHPKALIPPATPLLAVVDLSRRACADCEARAASAGGSRPSHQQQPRSRHTDTAAQGVDGSGATEPDLFGVSHKGLESMAYTVSVLSTDLLEEESKRAALPGGDATAAYQDLTEAVSQTVSELLTDPAITTAIQRRAKDKYQAMVAERELLQRSTKSDREKLIIAKAEAEAERVVRQIMQEMVARDPTAALPRT